MDPKENPHQGTNPGRGSTDDDPDSLSHVSLLRQSKREQTVSSVLAVAPVLSAAENSWGVKLLGTSTDFGLNPPKMIVVDLGIGVGRPCLVLGPDGSGKTVTSYSIGVAAAAGRKALGRFECAQSRVLIVGFDIGEATIKMHVHRILNGMGLAPAEVGDRLTMIGLPNKNFAQTNATELAALFSGFDLVIVDNLRDSLPGIDENSSLIGEHVKKCQRAAGDSTAIVFLHHTPISDAGRPRGSSAIPAAGGTIWVQQKTEEGPRTLTNIRTHDWYSSLMPTYTLALVECNEGVFEVPRIGPASLAPKGLRIEAHEGGSTQRNLGRPPKGIEEVRTYLLKVKTVPTMREIEQATGIARTSVSRCMMWIEREKGVPGPFVVSQEGGRGWTYCGDTREDAEWEPADATEGEAA